jgi:hypothetical protein
MKTGRPEKYTIDFCLKEINEISKRLFSDGQEEGKIKYFTWHDLVRDKDYPRQQISEWRKKFVENKEFSDTIKKIESELENRLYKYALLNKINPTMAIFGLKNNYGWKDRTEIDQNIHIPTLPNIIIKANGDNADSQ